MLQIIRVLFVGCFLGVCVLIPAIARADRSAAWASVVPVQVPFDMPPKPGVAPDTAIPPSDKPFAPEDLQRAEALLPMLEGKQELWAMGEFVHLGKASVPVLVKGLKMPGPRLRYNAIETLSMIKDPSAVPALLEVAMQPLEMSRIREHALRTAIRLDPSQAPPAIALMAKDPNPTIRKAAAFEARYVRQKAVVPVLISLIPDDEQYVSISAVQSLWLLTRHETEMHNWEASTKQERQEWAQEWLNWWKENQETFQLPEPRRPRKPL